MWDLSLDMVGILLIAPSVSDGKRVNSPNIAEPGTGKAASNVALVVEDKVLVACTTQHAMSSPIYDLLWPWYGVSSLPAP